MYLLTNNFISNIYIYFNDVDIIVRPETAYLRKEISYDGSFKIQGMSYSEWDDYLTNRIHKKNYIGAIPIQDNSGNTSSVLYFNSIPIGNPWYKKGLICIQIEEANIQALLGAVNIKDGGAVYVFDQKGKWISSLSNGLDPIDFQDLGIEDSHGIYEKDIDGDNMIISYVTSPFNEWLYASIIPAKLVKSKVNFIKKIMWSVEIAILLAGLVFGVILAYRNSKPVREIFLMLKNFEGVKKCLKMSVYRR